MDGRELEQRMLEMMIKRVKEQTFPSVTMMDRIESALETREQISDYAEALLEKVEASRFPSITMLNRVDGLAARLG
jgi:hypothetical protein